jgi:hypothetical protein
MLYPVNCILAFYCTLRKAFLLEVYLCMICVFSSRSLVSVCSVLQPKVSNDIYYGNIIHAHGFKFVNINSFLKLCLMFICRS